LSGAGAPGPANGLTDVAGLMVGHWQEDRPPYLTGTTVVLAPEGARAGVDVRGGAPGTRETDALDPRSLVGQVHAVVLTGGSAYGLDAASGVMAWLEERGMGFPVGPEAGQVVPIVAAAVLFDLGRGGGWSARPGPSFGYRASAGASGGPVAAGCVGAGTGAVAGGIKGGVGTASLVLPDGTLVAALVAVNARGSGIDPSSGLPWAADHGLEGEFGPLLPPAEEERARLAAATEPRGEGGAGRHTTIGVVATDAALTRPEASKLAGVAHDGLARAVRPAHGPFDGDTFFALSTGRRELGEGTGPGDQPLWGGPRAARLEGLYEAGAGCVARAVVHALLAARGAGGVPSYRDLCPSAFGGGAHGR